MHGINDCYNFSTKKGKEYFQQNSFFPTSTFHVCLFFLNKVVDIEKGTISQVDPLGGRNSDFFYVVRYDILKIQSVIKCKTSFHILQSLEINILIHSVFL